MAHRARSTTRMNIQLSPAAAEHLRHDLDGRVLRIAFTTGCGGSGYRLSYAPEPVESDEVIAIDGVRVALDSMAASRLDGAIIEYHSDEDGYLLDHPDAVNAVWCG